MTDAEEQLVGHVAAAITPPSAHGSEIKFWARVAHKAVYAMRFSPTHALVRRPRTTPMYRCWVWDCDMKELVPLKESPRL
jgi:hypothetical protein